jgi:hypothetical protein
MLLTHLFLFSGYLDIFNEDLCGYPQSLQANTGIAAQIKSNDVLTCHFLLITFQTRRVGNPRPAFLFPEARRRLTRVEKFRLRKRENGKNRMN